MFTISRDKKVLKIWSIFDKNWAIERVLKKITSLSWFLPDQIFDASAFFYFGTETYVVPPWKLFKTDQKCACSNFCHVTQLKTCLLHFFKHFSNENSIKLQKIPKTNANCDEICILSGFGPNTETVRNFYRQLNKKKMANCEIDKRFEDFKKL